MQLGICLPHYGVTMEPAGMRTFAERVSNANNVTTDGVFDQVRQMRIEHGTFSVPSRSLPPRLASCAWLNVLRLPRGCPQIATMRGIRRAEGGW